MVLFLQHPVLCVSIRDIVNKTANCFLVYKIGHRKSNVLFFYISVVASSTQLLSQQKAHSMVCVELHHLCLRNNMQAQSVGRVQQPKGVQLMSILQYLKQSMKNLKFQTSTATLLC